MSKRVFFSVAAANVMVACLGLAGVGLAANVLPRTELAGARPAAYMGSEGRIAFVRHGDIYSIEPSGSGLRLLAGGGHDAGPRWSPNGSKLAYLDGGNLWVMHADGSHKHQITSGAPKFTDGRPSWSPSGRYLAFVRTAQHARQGLLTRYDTLSGHFVTFTTMIPPPTLIKVPARPGTAVAWQRTVTDGVVGYFLLYEGIGPTCEPTTSCLAALGFDHESQFSNGEPSLEDSAPLPKRFTDPDWYPIRPDFAIDVLVSVASCPVSGCTHTGIQLTITSPLILPGAYQAVYSPTGAHIAFVRNGRSGPQISIKQVSPVVARTSRVLTAGTEPDWQPTAPFPPA